VRIQNGLVVLNYLVMLIGRAAKSTLLRPRDTLCSCLSRAAPTYFPGELTDHLQTLIQPQLLVFRRLKCAGKEVGKTLGKEADIGGKLFLKQTVTSSL